MQPEIDEMVRGRQWDELREVLAEMDPPDVAELIEDLPDEQEDVAVFRMLPREQAGRVFSYMNREHQELLLRSLSNDQMRAVLAGMTPDDQVRLLDELPAEVTRRLLETLSPDELKAARDLLGYPVGTAGRYMTPNYVALPPDMTSREALRHVKKIGRGKETLNILFVVDANGKLVEELRLGSLVLADDETKVAEIDDRPLVSIPATATGDEVVTAFERYDRAALPVVDAEGKMLGIITHDDVLEFAERKATREIQKLGGSEALDAPYFDVGFWPMARKRGGWLAALFLGETLTATAMGKYEHAIAQAAVLALFVPLIISSGGNSGSQATSILIRSLALQEVKLRDWWRVCRKELLSSFALGVFLGAIGLFRICLWYWLGWQTYEDHPYLMGFTVWASLIGVVMFGSLVGSMLPFLLRRLGFDPATASAPFVATLVDVTGLVIYFTVASVILRGTLLKAPDQTHAPTEVTAHHATHAGGESAMLLP
ncbi:MAG TPA: magnesium transporter [Tepidisphaeraceae bacterium]